MSVQQRLSQGGMGLLNQQGLMNGMLGGPGSAMANAGNLASNMNGFNAMNNIGGMANSMNLGNAGAGSFNAMSQMTPAANLNNFNANDFMRLQQQMQQQQLQQQMIQQQQLQQMQLQNNGLNAPSPQNMNFALMAAQNQSQANPSAQNNLLQSLMGRNLMTPQAQNPFLGQMLGMNPQVAASQAGLMGNASTGMNSLASPNSLFSRDATRRMRGGVIEPFPEKLHRLLLEVEACGRADVISFVANGRAFAIHKADAFFKDIVPLYFRQSRLSSFKRQLNLYGFELINTGPARGGYYHEMFVKERPELCRRMRRVAVKVAPSKDTKKKKMDEEEEESKDNASKGEATTKPEEAASTETTKDDTTTSEPAAKPEVAKTKETTTTATAETVTEDSVETTEDAPKEEAEVKAGEKAEESQESDAKETTSEI